jgi:hypothetical protein
MRHPSPPDHKVTAAATSFQEDSGKPFFRDFEKFIKFK